MATRPADLTVNLFDVEFLWRNPGRSWREPVHKGLDVVHKLILEHAYDGIHRQKRTSIFYFDALTGYLRGELRPASADGRKQWEIAAELAVAIRDGRLADDLILERANVEPVYKVRSWIDVVRPPSEDTRSEEERRRVVRTYDIHGRPRRPKAGLYRRFELEAWDLGGDPSSVDWLHVLALAVRVQVRADLELYVETGVLPIRCCERESCHSFFSVRMMATKQRFCSDTCRACAPREQ